MELHHEQTVEVTETLQTREVEAVFHLNQELEVLTPTLQEGVTIEVAARLEGLLLLQDQEARLTHAVLLAQVDFQDLVAEAVDLQDLAEALLAQADSPVAHEEVALAEAEAHEEVDAGNN